MARAGCRPLMVLVLVCLAVSGVVGQDVLDRILSRVYDDIVTLSDVRQARLLGLVSPEATTDAAVQREIENRILMLREIGRAPQAEPAAAELGARRRQWEAALGTGASVEQRLRDANMEPAALDAWLRDDVRLQAYFDRRFGGPDTPDRARLIAEWVGMLRQRAGLR